MKTKYYIIIGALLFCTATAKADGLFGAGLKPAPNITLFGQKLTWPIPSICIGAKAGVLPDAGLSPEGVNFKIPYLSVDIPFPGLTLKTGKDKPTVEVKLGAVNKQKK